MPILQCVRRWVGDRTKGWIGILAGFVALGGAGAASPLTGQSTTPGSEPPTILFVDDFDLNRTLWQLTFQSLRDRIQQDAPNTVFFTETLDVQQVSDPWLRQETERWLVQKYRDRPLSLLIGHGPQALQALLALREASGQNIPILHLRADASRPDRPEDMPSIPNGSSLLLGPVEGEVARVIQTLLPAVRTLILVVDSEQEAAALQARFERGLGRSVRQVALVRPTHARAREAVEAAGVGVAVYYTLVRQDEDGRPWDQQDYLRVLSAETSVPVFTAFTTQLGTGTLGGTQVDPSTMGRFVGEVAAELLQGRDPNQIELRLLDSWSLTLDWTAVQQHQIPRSRIPGDAIWVGRPDYFWKVFPRTTGLLAGLFLLLVGTGVNLHLRSQTIRRARDARSQLSRRLMAVLDRDRSRVARDLHDDLCQELTVIALQLDRNQPPPADRVRELIDRTRAIAHDLHAAPLDRMPFQDAVVMLARNTAEHALTPPDSGGFEAPLKVTVESRNWPDRLSDDIALNLYRSVQESLQNVVRHAQARSCTIRLEGLGDTCRIRISDDGIGFPADRSGEGGLGLLGMRERMVSLGGRLSVESRAGRGTEVRLIVPLGSPLPESAPEAGRVHG